LSVAERPPPWLQERFSRRSGRAVKARRPAEQERKMRVLVVEGERRLAAGLGKGLVAEGYAVDVALDRTEGSGWPGSPQ
jgi:hypothetical protein